MTDKPKTWQEIAQAVCAGGRARGVLEVGELWNAIEEMADRITEGEADRTLGQMVRDMPVGFELYYCGAHQSVDVNKPWYGRLWRVGQVILAVQGSNPEGVLMQVIGR